VNGTCRVNGTDRSLPSPHTVVALLDALELRPGTVVIELNGVALTRPEAALGYVRSAEAIHPRVAKLEQVDFCVGPIWATPTKSGRPAVGLGLVAYAAEAAAGKPWFAIGGIDHGRLGEVLTAGATRVVVVRAITEAADPAAAARSLRDRLPA
jgi:thiamine-phosphate diphosphorylase